MKKFVLICLMATFLTACDSPEVKATKNLAAAKELIAKGDTPRALVELRNALKNDASLREARLLFADLLLQSGRRSDAFGLYRYLVEKDPNDSEASRALALIAFDAMSWEDARKYVDAALAGRPEDPDLLAVRYGLDYRDAAQGKDTDALARAAAGERKLLAADPKLLRARRIVLADAMRQGDFDNALAIANDGLALSPNDRDLNNVRLFILGRQGKADDIESQILSMIALYPDDAALGTTLVQFYLNTGRLDDAEKTLRARIEADSDNPEPRLVLLRFLSEVRSPAAMRDELARLLAENPLPKDVASQKLTFQALKAQADFTLGDRDKAQADLEALIKAAGEPSAEIDKLKVRLAAMRNTVGNTVGARALVEEVLAHDPSQTEALKAKSLWLVEEDKTETAISLLRDALADAPNDAQILTLLARAYQREGNTEVMSDMLARAVEVAHQAPEESLNYARWLLQGGQFTAAETVALDALRREPKNLDLLVILARTHLAMKDWGRSEQDINAISERFNTDQARGLANELRAQLLSQQGRNDDLSQLLNQLSRDSGNALGPRIAVIRNMVSSGNMEQALERAKELVAAEPDAPAAAALLTQIQAALGQNDAARDTLDALIARHPDYLPAHFMKFDRQLRAEDYTGALATLDGALALQPGNRQLLLGKSFVLEKTGDIDGAITIYETLYAANSDDVIVANNLASLLSSTRTDEASLERAWIVARRLNGAQVPAFQDTYGWLAFRRGELDQALNALEPAARGLPDDPSVAYHLGQVYAAKGRAEEARAEYTRARALLDQGIVTYPGLAGDLVRAEAALSAN